MLAIALLVLGIGLWGMGERGISVAGGGAEVGAGGYTVSMSPVGEVRFVRPPERIVTWDAHYNDMLVALGREGGLVATGMRDQLYEGFYAELGWSAPRFEPERLEFLVGESGSFFDKELLYALDGDVHHMDPMRLAGSRSWTLADVEEIARNVGPFFGNRYSRTNDYPGDEPYDFYTLWELSGKVGEVHQRAARIAELEAIHRAMTARIQATLPPLEERPTVGLVIYSDGKFLPFSLSREGFGTAQYRAVGAVDAFAAIQGQTYADAGRGTRLDIEGLLAIDPDVLIVPWAILPYLLRTFEELETLADDPLGERLKAVANGRLFPGGTPLQGPLVHLFQTEMAAKQIYPEVFGRFRLDGRYPPEEQLFDRAAVRRVVESAP